MRKDNAKLAKRPADEKVEKDGVIARFLFAPAVLSAMEPYGARALLPFVPRFWPLLTAASGFGNRLSCNFCHMADFSVLEGEMRIE